MGDIWGHRPLHLTFTVGLSSSPLAGHQSENRSTFTGESLSLETETRAQPSDRRRSEACQARQPPLFLDHVKMGPWPTLSHIPRQWMKTHMQLASTDRVLSGITNINKKLIYVTWQLFYTISWPLKNLKETVVFYYVLCNLWPLRMTPPCVFFLWSCLVLSLGFK